MSSDNPVSVGELYGLYNAFARNCVRKRFILRGDDLDDVMQNTWLKIAQGIDRMRPADWKPWIATIAIHEAINLKRRQRVRATEPMLTEDGEPLEIIDETAIDPAWLCELIDTARWIKADIALLPDSQREAVEAVVLDGMTHQQAAAMAGVTRATIYNRITAAVEAILARAG